MPIPRLRPDDTLLLVVDLQERLMPTITRAESVVHHAGILVELARVLSMPVVLTEQYVKGLGPTVEPLRSRLADASLRVEKTRFSGLVDPVRAFLDRSGRRNVLVCGCEAHVCILQTTLDLLGAGFVPWLVTDAIGASSDPQIPIALRRMEAAGAIATGVMSAMYELLGDARHESFKACLELAKQVRRE